MISAQGRTQVQWEIRKSEQTIRSWAALYQQHPTPVEGAVWKARWIETNRDRTGDFHPNVVKVIVGVDPAATSKSSSDETGIVVVGMDREGATWVLDDRSGCGTRCSTGARPRSSSRTTWAGRWSWR